ncbi:Hypothetical predicted protein [Pelobates cultripes]|uniref:Uncharacterized protein n=1 Tax=Pelobates cultripes TaxID=61616 RepID=A0AAD1R5U7_PELCU|nr:Hypothetical predicted protein [Pelobates cultripes]
MRQMHAADPDLIKTEVQAVTAPTQASEEDIQDLRKEVQDLKETVQHLKTSQATISTRVDQAEDRHRRTNFKIRGIPDSVDVTELANYLRRLFSKL